MRKIRKDTQKGFTLIELIVALAVFTIVVLISIGSLFSIIHSNRKAQAQKSVMNNLQFAVESMTRSMRVGTLYHCDASVSPLDGRRNCASGAGSDSIAFEYSGGDELDVNDQVVYRLQDKAIERSVDGGDNYIPITAPEVEVDNLRFFVNGALDDDLIQPQVLIVIQGHAGTSTVESLTEFNIQTFVTQRELDS